MVANRVTSNASNAAIYIKEGINFLYSAGATMSSPSWEAAISAEPPRYSVGHAANGVINGASSILNIDGAETTGSITTITTTDPFIWAGGSSTFSAAFQEGIIFDGVTLTSTQRNAICANQFAYWGTSTPSGTC